MPSKSKRNRRILPQNKIVVKSPAGTAGESISPVSINKPERTPSGYSSNIKATSAVPIESHFISELKWIGLVTLIVIILLIVAFYVVPR
jgi:hypothetical protein